VTSAITGAVVVVVVEVDSEDAEDLISS